MRLTKQRGVYQELVSRKIDAPIACHYMSLFSLPKHRSSVRNKVLKAIISILMRVTTKGVTEICDYSKTESSHAGQQRPYRFKF